MFERVAAALVAAGDGVEQGRMLRSVGLKSGGKFFALVVDEELVVKIPAERVEELLSTDAGRSFASGRGRPMREWVRLRPPDEATCRADVVEARGFVERGR